MTIQDGMSDTIVVPDAPAVPGLRFRRFRGPADYPEILAVIECCTRVDGTEEAISLEELARSYERPFHCDPYQDMLFAEVDGRVIGYGRVWWMEDNSARLYAHFARLMPPWRGQGIWEAMVRCNERRLREIAVAQQPGGEGFFQAWAEEGQGEWQVVLQGQGYQPVHYGFFMVRPDLQEIPELPLPEGLEVRPVQPEHYALIIAALNDAFRDNWGFVGFSQEWFENWQALPSFDPSLWLVAWHGDQVAGTVLSYIDETGNRQYRRQRGHTEYISVRRSWRRKGLARALIARALRLIRDRGMTEAALGVDAENATGALRLYEGMGFRRVRTTTTFRKPL